ncbi:MAG TPA: hypothetical protein DDW50_16025 [Firmicutes bacterium]|nr:hypothetical protein [Bacillota bacterium]
MTVFKYRQKYFLKILLLVGLALLPRVIDKPQLYLSLPYYGVLISLEAILYIFSASKRIIVTEKGIEEKFLWNMPFSTTKWEYMEEASEIINNPKSTEKSLTVAAPPFAGIRWLVEKNVGNLIKIIVSNQEPLYIHLKDIENSPELYKIIKEKVRFIRS